MTNVQKLIEKQLELFDKISSVGKLKNAAIISRVYFEKSLVGVAQASKVQTAENICILLDSIESSDPNTSMEQWKQYKHIRNTIRDIHVLPYVNELTPEVPAEREEWVTCGCRFTVDEKGMIKEEKMMCGYHTKQPKEREECKCHCHTNVVHKAGIAVDCELEVQCIHCQKEVPIEREELHACHGAFGLPCPNRQKGES